MKQPQAKEIRIAAARVRSLNFRGDSLIDWAGGGASYEMDGTCHSRPVYYAYNFNAAVTLPGSEYTVLYARFNTKGLVLKGHQLVREINRSYYHAQVYDYPIALGRLPDGREVIVHCPEEYNRLEIEEVESGRRLSASAGRAPCDFFHSRLEISPDGRHLLSAGWVWHPLDEVLVINLAAALQDSAWLDDAKMASALCWGEGSSACFFGNDTVLAALYAGEYRDEIDDHPNECDLRSYTLAGMDETVAAPRFEPPHVVPLQTRPGKLMPVGEHHVLCLYEHPRLVERATGNVVQTWPHLNCGARQSSIEVNGGAEPPLALDPGNRRCAIASHDAITVLEFGI